MPSFFLVLLVLAAIVEVIVANGQYVAPTIWPQVRYSLVYNLAPV